MTELLTMDGLDGLRAARARLTRGCGGLRVRGRRAVNPSNPSLFNADKSLGTGNPSATSPIRSNWIPASVLCWVAKRVHVKRTARTMQRTSAAEAPIHGAVLTWAGRPPQRGAKCE